MTKSNIKTRTCLGAVAVGAVAGLLAMSSWAPAQEAASKDEVFSVSAVVSPPTGQQFKTYDISYVDAVLGLYVLADRTNKAVDVVDTTSLKLTQLPATPPFAGQQSSNALSGPDGVIIVRAADNGDGVDEVWAGDAPNPMTTCPITGSVPDLAGDPNNGLPSMPPKCSSVKVIDLKTGVTKHVIATGGKFRADESCIDTKDGLFMTANNADSPPFGTIISLTDYTVKNQISFTFSTNGAEQCQWSPRTGLFYITIPGINTPDDGTGEVLAIDPKSGTIVKTFPISLNVCSTPQGLAVGPNSQIMVGCNEGGGVSPPTPSTNGLHSGIIINENSGSVIGVIPDESGPDEVYYNAGDGQYFLARSAPPNHTMQLLGVVDANGKRADQSVVTVPTKVGVGAAHSVAAGPNAAGTNQVFVPIPFIPAKTLPVGTLGTCSSNGGSDINGCIAVFTASPDDNGKPIVRNDD
jgi:hypothetical protein